MGVRPKKPVRAGSRSRPATPRTWFPRFNAIGPTGFLSFGPDSQPVRPGPLNVFIGANGSGKSNLFEAVRFLKEAQRDLRGFLTRNNQVADWIFEGSPTTGVTAEFSLEPGVDWFYELNVEARGHGDFGIESESLFQADTGAPGEGAFLRRGPDIDGRTGAHLDTSRPALNDWRNPRDDTPRRETSNFLGSVQFFTEWGFGRRTNPLRSVGPSATVQGELLEDGSNAPLVLNALLQRKGFRNRIIEHVGAVMPGVSDVLVDVVMNATQVVFLENARELRTPGSRLSDGTLHWLILGVILLDEERSSPLFLDEPELGLHPDAIDQLALLLKEASRRRQIFVSTHSSLLLSAFSETPECVFVFDRDKHGTRVDRLDSNRIKGWLGEGKSLGDIWAAGAVGGNRW